MIRTCDIYGEEYTGKQRYGDGTRRQRQFQKIRSKWDYNIKVHLQDVELEGVGWCDIARNTDKCLGVVNTEMIIWVR